MLISVLVVSYNSSKTILETLDSIHKQSYELLELIISDDGSTDQTVPIVQCWIESSKSRFASIKFIKNPINTGIPANFNRGIKQVTGEWVKIIAADDILLPNCVEELVKFSMQTGAKIIGANMRSFGTNSKKDVFEVDEHMKSISVRMQLAKLEAADQYQKLLRSYTIATPTLFIKKEVYDKVRYDEKFVLLEDYPFMLNATSSGFSYDHLNLTLVKYRVSNSSVYHKDKENVLVNYFYKVEFLFAKVYRIPFLKNHVKLACYYDYYLRKMFYNSFLNKNTSVNLFIFKILNKLNVFRYF